MSKRERVDGIPIGCPAMYGEAPCHPCGGGWPGTTAPSEKLIEAARKGVLNPKKLGCGMLEEQALFMQRRFNGHQT